MRGESGDLRGFSAIVLDFSENPIFYISCVRLFSLLWIHFWLRSEVLFISVFGPVSRSRIQRWFFTRWFTVLSLVRVPGHCQGFVWWARFSFRAKIFVATQLQGTRVFDLFSRVVRRKEIALFLPELLIGFGLYLCVLDLFCREQCKQMCSWLQAWPESSSIFFSKAHFFYSHTS
jgi:hypothetical protein